MGRLFDAVSSLLGIRDRSRFEGQAAMELEFAIQDVRTEAAYDLPVVPSSGSALILDWQPLLKQIVQDLLDAHHPASIAARFHNALAEAIVRVAMHVEEPRIALTGGCFQNAYLLERAVIQLRRAGFQPFWHCQVPANDGGIALGQVSAARRHPAGGHSPFIRTASEAAPE
jgi:hydrogenase maturation protein HypF